MPAIHCGKLIDAMLLAGSLDYTIVEDPQAQKWLLARVPHVIEQSWIGANRGNCKPIMDAISVAMKLGILPDHKGLTTRPAHVTYTQLRVFLKAQGYIAALEKSSSLPAPLLPPTVTPVVVPTVLTLETSAEQMDMG